MFYPFCEIEKSFFFRKKSELALCLQVYNQRKMHVSFLFLAVGEVINRLTGSRQATQRCWCWGNFLRDGHAMLTDPEADVK